MIPALPLAVVGIATFFAFFPSLSGEFLNWDDDINFVTNPHYRGLGFSQLKWMLTTFHMGHYIPVTWVTFGADYLLWGMNPWGYHLTNILLHTFAAIVFTDIVGRLWKQTGTVSQAAPLGRTEIFFLIWTVLSFFIHPLRVESVAWITERRDVLCGLFFLFATRAYLLACGAITKTEKNRHLRWSLFFHLAAVFSKPLAVMFPVATLLLDIYPLRRVSFARSQRGKSFPRLIQEKWPFLFASLLAGILSIAATQSLGQFRDLHTQGIAGRLAQASYAIASLFLKTLFPIRFSPLYDFSPALNPLHAQFIASFLFIVLVTVLLGRLRRTWPGGLTAWAWFIVLLLPTLGIAVAQSLTQDRYSYLACLAGSPLLGGTLLHHWRKQSRPAKRVTAVVLCAFLLFCFVKSWRQSAVWKSSTALWSHAVRTDPTLFIAHYNLGTALSERNRHDEAIRHYQAAVDRHPGYARAHHNWGISLEALGLFQEAETHYLAAIRLNPRLIESHNALGLLCLKRDKTPEALKHFKTATDLRPDDPEGHNNMAYTHLLEGDYQQAILHLKNALRADATFSKAHNNLGIVLMEQKMFQESSHHFETAVRWDPSFAEAYNNWGNARAALGDLEGAIDQYRKAVQIDPGLAQAYFNLGLALRHSGRQEEASLYHEKAFALNPALEQRLSQKRGRSPKTKY